MMLNLFNKRKKEIITTITISSKKSPVEIGDNQKSCLISVKIGNEEFFYFTDVNIHYKIKDFPLYAIEYLKSCGKGFWRKVEKQIIKKDTFIKINNHYLNVNDLNIKLN